MNKDNINDEIKEELKPAAADEEKVDMVAVDMDGDGVADIVYADTSGDGRMDTMLVDVDGDGVADAMFVDLDGDGTFDVAVTDDSLEGCEGELEQLDESLSGKEAE